MFQRVWFINAVLAMIVIFLSIKVYGVWSDGYGAFHKIALKGNMKSVPFRKIPKRKVPAESLYEVIVSKNIFSPDRTEPTAEKSEDKGKPAELPGTKVYLYGVILSDDYKRALVTNPVHGKGEKKEIWVQAGDKVGDFKVVEILKESIILAKGLKEYEISLYDKNKPERKAGSRRGRMPSVFAHKGGKPTVVAADAGKKGTQAVKKASKGYTPPVQEVESGGKKYRIIDTPFGKIKRRIK